VGLPEIWRGVSRRSRVCVVFTFIISVRRSHTKLPLWGCHGMLRRSCVCVVLTFIINMRHSRATLLLWGCCGVPRRSRVCAVFIFIMNVHHSHQIATLGVPRCASACPCVRSVHFHLECAPLLHQIAGVPQCVRARCSFSVSLAVPGCAWLLLAAPDCS
jgi:hypothetical protein